jgi:hypothetical protein
VVTADLDPADVLDGGQPLDQLQGQRHAGVGGVEQPDADVHGRGDRLEPLVEALVRGGRKVRVDQHRKIGPRLLRVPGQLDGLPRRRVAGVRDHRAFASGAVHRDLDHAAPLASGQGPELAHHAAAEDAADPQAAGQPVEVAAQRVSVQVTAAVERRGGRGPQPGEALPGRLFGVRPGVVHGMSSG